MQEVYCGFSKLLLRIKTFRPCLIAALACFNVPDVSDASTMIVAWDNAAIVIFRSGKNKRVKLIPFSSYETIGTWLINK